jgi:hypothetical protein
MQKGMQVREQMFSMISNWQRSGLNQKAYCAEHNIRYHVFHYWYKVYRHQSALPEASFVKVQITPSPVSSSVELFCTDGKRLVFYQPVTVDYLKALIS